MDGNAADKSTFRRHADNLPQIAMNSQRPVLFTKPIWLHACHVTYWCDHAWHGYYWRRIRLERHA